MKLRCIDNSGNGKFLTMWKEYEIIAVSKGLFANWLYVTVKLDDDTTVSGIYASRFGLTRRDCLKLIDDLQKE